MAPAPNITCNLKNSWNFVKIHHKHQCPWGLQLGATKWPLEWDSSTMGCATTGSQGRKRGLAGLTEILTRKQEVGAEGSGGCFSERRPSGGAAGFLPRATTSLTECQRAPEHCNRWSALPQNRTRLNALLSTQLLWSLSGSSYRWLRQPAAGMFLGASL